MSLLTNLISYWKMEGNSNDSVSSNNGTDTAITYGTSYGKIGQGALFNGTTSKIIIADSTSLKPTGSFTISHWFKTSTAVNDPVLFQSSSNVPTSNGIVTYLDSALGRIVTIISRAGTLVYCVGVTESAGVTNNVWHLFTATYDGTNIRNYLDGVLDANGVDNPAASAAPTYNATNYIRIGSGNNSGTEIICFTGDLDEVGVWSRALTATEITQLYNGGLGLTYPFGSGNFLMFM